MTDVIHVITEVEASPAVAIAELEKLMKRQPMASFKQGDLVRLKPGVQPPAPVMPNMPMMCVAVLPASSVVGVGYIAPGGAPGVMVAVADAFELAPTE